MRKLFIVIICISLTAVVGGLFALETNRISYVYVPSPTGPTNICTVILFGYTATDNFQTPIIRTASSFPTTHDCRQISIYPDPSGSY